MRKIAINLETQKRNTSRSLPVIVKLFQCYDITPLNIVSKLYIWSAIEFIWRFYSLLLANEQTRML
jgi:hypothetical protein